MANLQDALTDLQSKLTELDQQLKELVAQLAEGQAAVRPEERSIHETKLVVLQVGMGVACCLWGGQIADSRATGTA
jgi:predicted  nucleic acid-binding Zn-ribbon protein